MCARATLVVEPICGLANRLLAWLSARRVAEACGRDLILIWADHYRSPAAHAKCRLEHLFAGLPPQAPSFDALDSTSLVRLMRRPRYVPWDDPAVPGVIDLCSQGIIDPDAYRDVRVLGVTTFHVVRLPDDTYDALLRAIAPYFLELAPVPSIEAAVHRIRQRRFDRPVLGIHIRRGDHVAMLERIGVRSPTEEDFRTYVDACLDARPDLRLFCASDDAAAKQRFLERYGDRACGYAASADRTTTTGGSSALVDLLLLSHASFICGTRDSSFTRVAALRNLAARASADACIIRLEGGIRDDAARLSALVTQTLAAVDLTEPHHDG